MNFPDQVYINHIRDALWRRSPIGQAAVMVGAGFSRNARPATVAGGSLPTWSELTHRILNALYPEADAGQAWRRLSAEREMGATSGFLRLAEEYATAFGRLALEELIMELVPDRRFLPSELHNDLLALPWSDVLTTNWDTLLERAAEDVPERRYDVVTTMTEIAGSVKPRIVKLHGSMPSVRPFIFTEEDFRTYPRQYAPFVNLAQQTLMENVLCLIGFSGDDPNFLRWAGWVRDNLGVNQPRIYLVGGLDLSNSRRRLLEEQKVVPIDLARLPEWQMWPEAVRHQNAVRWFLDNLWRGQPYTKTQWPNPEKRNRGNLPKDWTQPPGNDGAFPCEERPSGMTAENATAANVLIVTQNWRHNRLLYSGWIVAPSDIRQTVLLNTKNLLTTILRISKDLTPFEKFYVFHELVWRLDLCLTPLHPDISIVLDEVLQICSDDWENNEKLQKILPSKSEIRQAWVTMTVSRLRHAREMEDRSKFDALVERLKNYIAETSGLAQRLCYEQCLLALTELDYTAVDCALADWPDSADDPFWNVRKAAILAEIKRTAEAERLVTTAYKEIRRRARKDTDDIPAMSREAWTTLFLSLGFRTTKPLASLPESRWEFLSAYRCDAQAEYRAIQGLMDQPPPPRPQKYSVKPGFDPGSKTHWQHFTSETPFSRLMPAYQARRWVEETGLPRVVNLLTLRTEILTSAANWLTEEDAETALGIRLRLANIAGESDPLFNRPCLALIRDERIIQMYGRATRLINFGLQHVHEGGGSQEARDLSDYWLKRVRFAMELASRLVGRLPEDKVTEAAELALRLYNNPIIGKIFADEKEFKNLFKRSFAALSEENRRNYGLRLLELAIPYYKQFEPSNQYWQDIVDVLNTLTVPPERKPEDERRWAQAITSMLQAARTPAARPWAIRRLVKLHSWGLLTDEECQGFADALWQETRTDTGLPNDTSLYDWVFMILPEPEPGKAKEKFKKKYGIGESIVGFYLEYILNICWATELRDGKPAALALSEAEIVLIMDAMLNSPIRRKPDEDRIFGHTDVSNYQKYAHFFVRLLYQTVIPSLPTDYPRIDDLMKKLEELEEAEYPVTPIYPPLLRLKSDSRSWVYQKIRDGLVSSESSRVKSAIWAVERWLYFAADWNIAPPSDDLVEEVALIIAQRRSAGLLVALSSCREILNFPTREENIDRTKDIVTPRFKSLLLDGLSFLQADMGYKWKQPPSGIDAEDVPTIRAACVRLAATMRQTINWEGGQIPEVLDRWLEAGRTDPLAEVRNAVPAPGPFGAGG